MQTVFKKGAHIIENTSVKTLCQPYCQQLTLELMKKSRQMYQHLRFFAGFVLGQPPFREIV